MKQAPEAVFFSRVRPFYEQAVSNLEWSMRTSLWVYVAHSSYIEGTLMTKNTTFGLAYPTKKKV
jgi:hypothetical protein